MKTLSSCATLIGGAFMLWAGSADAQVRCSRGWSAYRRVVVHEPTRVVSRPVVTEPVITFGGFSHVDDLAVRLEQLAREVCWEMHLNYAHNPDYLVTYAEAYEMLRQAKYIHQEEHHGHRGEIARVVGELDRLFHHVEDDIRTWQPSHDQFVGHGSLFDKMERMEDTLHHLMQDAGVTASVTDPPAPGLNSDPPLPSQSPLPVVPTLN
jgi:hypothetical protein